MALRTKHNQGNGMADTGFIDWHRLARTRPWAATDEGSTFVYAFFAADYGRNQRDHGVTLLKDEGAHPDWFLHAEAADKMLFSVGVDNLLVSPNVGEVYDQHLTSRPLLAGILLGTAKTTYAKAQQYWWCSVNDLTRPGKRLIKQMSMLYLRPAVIVTFLEMRPMSPADPGVAGTTATASETPGQHLPE